MRTIDVDDYTQDPVAVAKKLEAGPMSAERIQEEFELFYDANPDLLQAHVEAAKLLNEHGVTVSATFLTQLVRWMSKMWPLWDELRGIDEDIIVQKVETHGGDFKVANVTATPLGRYLKDLGFKVRLAKSKLDGEKHG